MIKKCLFPAAGYGTRFLPATKAMPKEMLPVVNKPLIQYGVEEALDAGLAGIADLGEPVPSHALETAIGEDPLDPVGIDLDVVGRHTNMVPQRADGLSRIAKVPEPVPTVIAVTSGVRPTVTNEPTGWRHS